MNQTVRPRIVASACPHDCPSTCALEVEGDAGRVDELAGRQVGPLASAAGELWAIVDERELWRDHGRWERIASWSGPRLTCLLATSAGLTVVSITIVSFLVMA